ncbi:embryonic stem cell-specific 5-hydroxymethylcytosine-binding protein-like [Centruroides sculpturatus]|uniref:embryonic stem cell-specific 5-hydroxymethylcytosine-binding protein-like n=1 Tax=Centruroides sculpturatus TaxID=218467 RepID=UPI000C6D4C15|nr:embryonic stem cell-specific 5-hydroxymethylcytosine-binding protein-like [Centruroides sculpturatus]
MKERNWTTEEENKWAQKGWSGPNLLTMAGLFDIWKSETGELLYSYTVITVEASSSYAYLHSRMPAILNGDNIQKWLDYGTITTKEAVKLLRPAETLEWYPVSNIVNNSQNKSIECVLPIKAEKNIPTKNKFLANWLKKANVSKDDKADQPLSKQIKLK